MFSLSRAIEKFSIRRQEKLLSRKLPEDHLVALAHDFGTSSAMFMEVFAKPVEDICFDYPRIQPLKNIGLNAFLATQNIEPSLFSGYMELIKSGRTKLTNNHYENDGKHSFVAYYDEFNGRNVRLLTNDIALINSLAITKLNPPPPWTAWHELGPHIFNLQGDAQYWYENIWDTYWESLTLEQQDDFLDKHKPKFSPDEWGDWVEAVRTRDARYREKLKQEYEQDTHKRNN